MAASHTQAPLTRRTFNHFWDELRYCHQKAHHYMYVVGNHGLARRYVLRMRALLPSAKGNRIAIVAVTARALCSEFAGHWTRGTAHRERELDLVIQLHNSAGKHSSGRIRRFVLDSYERGAVKSRLLAIHRQYKTHATPVVVARFEKLVAQMRAWAGAAGSARR